MPDSRTSTTVARNPNRIIDQAQQRIAAIREALHAIDYVCAGTLLQRMKVCGKPNCRCAEDPAARHGPYFVWGHLENGSLVQQALSPEQAEILKRALANQRTVRKLMRAWHAETKRVINASKPA